MMTEAVAPDDGLPLVGEDRGNRGLWLGLGAIGLGGLLLFATLESSRRSAADSQIAPARDYAIAAAPRAELAIPGYYGPDMPPAPRILRPASPVPAAPQFVPVRPARVLPVAEPIPVFQPPPPVFQPAAPAPGRNAPAIVFDSGQEAAVGENAAPAAPANLRAVKAVAVGGGDRTYLVSQGTLIRAVLETAIDSTQPGQVRAMISNDVYNAAGTRKLIPKGSRIFGEYKGELGAGQNRAQISWTRLIRPDGATISIDSPASDQLGRAGVKGRVNTHFGERLLGALLQSTIDFGVLAASRAVSSGNGIIVAVPTAAQGATSQLVQPAPKPTLNVRHGTKIAVLVARDLDFSAVE